MKITLEREELLSLYEIVKKSNDPNAIATFNMIFGKNHTELIQLYAEGNGTTVVEMEKELTLPIMGIIDKNVYSIISTINGSKNPVKIIHSLKKIFSNISKEILDVFQR